MNNYQYYSYSATSRQVQPQVQPMQQSFARIPMQNSIMSVEEQSPQFKEAQLAQSKIFIQAPNENCQPPQQFIPTTPHRRQASHQFPQDYMPKSPIQRQANNSLCSSPICRHYIPCECELERLWEEFLETKLRQVRRSYYQRHH